MALTAQERADLIVNLQATRDRLATLNTEMEIPEGATQQETDAINRHNALVAKENSDKVGMSEIVVMLLDLEERVTALEGA